VLARQALLLYGPEATGVSSPADADATFGTDREYALYVRDLESVHRFWSLHSSSYGFDPTVAGNTEFTHPGPVFPSTEAAPEDQRPDPRLIYHGRVDVCAQTLEDVRRWLEGERPLWEFGTAIEAAALSDRPGSAFGVSTELPPDVSAVDAYDLDDNALRGSASGSFSIQKWLWKRAADEETTASIGTAAVLPAGFVDVGNALDNLAYNFIGIRSAIAGTFARPLVDPESSPSTRVSDTVLDAPARLRYAAEHDGGMDTHAVLAPRCSEFKISWSDGSYWVDDEDFDGDGQPDVREGDLVWFGPERLERDDRNELASPRRTYEELWDRYGLELSNPLAPSAGDLKIRWARAYSDSGAGELDLGLPGLRGEIGTDDGFPVSLNPEVGLGPVSSFETTNTFLGVSGGDTGRRLHVLTGGSFTPNNQNLPYYHPDLTGGVPSEAGWPDTDPAAPTDDMNQYLAVWPFRTPTSAGEWGPAQEKNVWVRVQFTLHDPLGRVDEGRDYEVVLHMHPREGIN